MRRNRYFSELPPEERKRYHQEIVSSVAQGARAVGDLTTTFNAYPGVEQFTVEVDNFSVVDGRYAYFDLPFTPSFFPGGTDTRTLPLYVSQQNERKVRTEIDLPAGFQQVAIAPKNRESGRAGWRRQSADHVLGRGRQTRDHPRVSDQAGHCQRRPLSGHAQTRSQPRSPGREDLSA